MAHFSVDSIDLFKCSYISRITKKENASFQQTHTQTKEVVRQDDSIVFAVHIYFEYNKHARQ